MFKTIPAPDLIKAYPAFQDAFLQEMTVRELSGDGPVVSLHYGLIGADGESIERRTSRIYFLSDPVDWMELCVDLRKLGFENPIYTEDLDRTAIEIEHGLAPYVELALVDPLDLGGDGGVWLIRRHR